MKRYAALCLFLIFMTTLCACGAAPGARPESAGAEEAAAPAAAPEYVWTITFDDTDTNSVMGVTVVSTFKGSMSHIGPDPLGEYKGEFALAYETDLGEIGALFDALGSNAYDLDGSGKNDAFTMTLSPFDGDSLQAFLDEQEANAQSAPLSEEEAEQMEMLMQMMGLGSMQPDEAEAGPGIPTDGAAMFYEANLPLTENNMQMFWSFSNPYLEFSTATDGDSAAGSASAWGGLASASATAERQLPYAICMDREGRITFTLISLSGGRSYDITYEGIIDAVPVGATTAAG